MSTDRKEKTLGLGGEHERRGRKSKQKLGTKGGSRWFIIGEWVTRRAPAGNHSVGRSTDVFGKRKESNGLGRGAKPRGLVLPGSTPSDRSI